MTDEKVNFGPTRSCKYPDGQADAIGNAFRIASGPLHLLKERIADCIRNRTPFVLMESVERENLKKPVETLYDGVLDNGELEKILAAAGDLYLGREIVGEYGGMVYWPQASCERVYVKMPDAADLTEAREAYHRQLREYAAKERHYGHGPFIGLCSCMCFPPLRDAIFDSFELEMMPGDPERLCSAFRGVTRAYSKKRFGTLIAHGFYGGGKWDGLYLKRLQNALHYAYLAGFNDIFSESGHFGFEYNGNQIRREDPPAVEFRRIMADFRKFCDEDRRPAGGPATPMAFLQGNLDGYPGLWAYCVWGQFEPDYALGDAEYGWRLTDAVHQKSAWHDNLACGEKDTSGQPPCGMYDIVPSDIPLERLNRYKLLVIPGWNTMTDDLHEKLRQYVTQGGTLLMSLAQMRTNIRRNEATRFFRDGDFSGLFGVKFTGWNPIPVTGIKFIRPEWDTRCLWPDWSLNCDPKSSGYPFRVATVESNGAVPLVVGSKHFTGSDDSPEEQSPVLLDYRLGKGRALLLNCDCFPGNPAVFELFRQVQSVLMRRLQPDNLEVIASDKIRYAVYGSAIYVMNSDCDLEGIFLLNGKKYVLNPLELKRIDMPQ